MAKLLINVIESVVCTGSYFDSSWGNFLPQEEVREEYTFSSCSDDEIYAIQCADIVADFIKRIDKNGIIYDIYRGNNCLYIVADDFRSGTTKLYSRDNHGKITLLA